MGTFTIWARPEEFVMQVNAIPMVIFLIGGIAQFGYNARGAVYSFRENPMEKGSQLLFLFIAWLLLVLVIGSWNLRWFALTILLGVGATAGSVYFRQQRYPHDYEDCYEMAAYLAEEHVKSSAKT